MPLMMASNSAIPVGLGAARQAPRTFMPLNPGNRAGTLSRMIPLHGEDKVALAHLQDLRTVGRINKQDMLIQKEPVKGEQVVSERVLSALVSSPIPTASTIPPLLPAAEEKPMEVANADIHDMQGTDIHGQNMEEMAADDEVDPALTLSDKEALTATTVDNTHSRSKDGYLWPVAAKDQWISSGYGLRVHPITKKKAFHGGIDIAAKTGAPVVAAAEGQVADVGIAPNLGRYVKIIHDDGTYTLYGHLSQQVARKGTKVAAGQLIGKVGATGRTTGPHLHFSICKKGGETMNPLAMLPHMPTEKTLASAE